MDLEQIRRQIDAVDMKMRDLFLERMHLSGQVAEAKKGSGQDVYVPIREREVIASRSKGIEEEYLPHCRAFFRQMMGISRTFQYARLSESADVLCGLPESDGEVVLCFSCGLDGVLLSACLHAVVTAGLSVRQLEVKERDFGLDCQIHLSGDFSDRLARASVLQILRETDKASYQIIK